MFIARIDKLLIDGHTYRVEGPKIGVMQTIEPAYAMRQAWSKTEAEEIVAREIVKQTRTAVGKHMMNSAVGYTVEACMNPDDYKLPSMYKRYHDVIESKEYADCYRNAIMHEYDYHDGEERVASHKISVYQELEYQRRISAASEATVGSLRNEIQKMRGLLAEEMKRSASLAARLSRLTLPSASEHDVRSETL